MQDSETGIDENLFLLHALEDTYRGWPDVRTAGPNEVAEWLTRTRPRMAGLRAAIQANELDPAVGMLYDDFLTFFDAYQSSLASLGLIDKQGKERGATDVAWLVFAGLREASKESGRAPRRGDAPVWAGLGAAILGGPGEGNVRSQERGHEHEPRLEAERRKLAAAWAATTANAQAAAVKLTEKYDWRAGEAGFDANQGRTLREYHERRARDPFVMVRFAASETERDTPAGLLEKAQTCVSAVDLVPPGDRYDPFRADFLKQAASLAVRATVMELEPFSYSLGMARSGPEAVRFCELYLAADPDDPSRVGHMLLSHALASMRDYDSAVEAANVALERSEHDANACYRYAKLMSLTNSLDLAGDWLGHAYRAGFHDIDFVRGDADLAAYRAERPEQYAEWTSVKWGFQIVWDNELDDVVVANESPFELTNVRVDLFVRQGSRTWEPSIRRDSLKPGEAYKAHDVLSVPGGRYDEAMGVLFCDQDP